MNGKNPYGIQQMDTLDLLHFISKDWPLQEQNNIQPQSGSQTQEVFTTLRHHNSLVSQQVISIRQVQTLSENKS